MGKHTLNFKLIAAGIVALSVSCSEAEFSSQSMSNVQRLRLMPTPSPVPTPTPNDIAAAPTPTEIPVTATPEVPEPTETPADQLSISEDGGAVATPDSQAISTGDGTATLGDPNILTDSGETTMVMATPTPSPTPTPTPQPTATPKPPAPSCSMTANAITLPCGYPVTVTLRGAGNFTYGAINGASVSMPGGVATKSIVAPNSQFSDVTQWISGAAYGPGGAGSCGVSVTWQRAHACMCGLTCQ